MIVFLIIHNYLSLTFWQVLLQVSKFSSLFTFTCFKKNCVSNTPVKCLSCFYGVFPQLCYTVKTSWCFQLYFQILQICLWSGVKRISKLKDVSKWFFFQDKKQQHWFLLTYLIFLNLFSVCMLLTYSEDTQKIFLNLVG